MPRSSPASIAGAALVTATAVLAGASAAPALLPPPVVFNASASARAGQIVGLQGAHFGSAPVVILAGPAGRPLPLVNRVGGGWLAVQLPADASGALVLTVQTAAGRSAPVVLNAARPLHLDALALAPGGSFRIFGRNLLHAGAMPVVTLDGLPVAVDLAGSNEHMLKATVPPGARPTRAAAIEVDNGNGSGPARLDRTITLRAAVGADPFALGVSWAAGFAPIARRVVDLAARVHCDGVQDDTTAVQRGIDTAAARGGARVQLPAGRCRIAGSLMLRSRVVLQGAGKAATELLYAADYPVLGIGLDLAGLRQLSLVNEGPSREGPLLKDSTRVVLQNVAVRLRTSRQMYLSGNRDVVIAGCDFEQTGSVSHQGPYTLDGSAGLVFEGNTTRWVDGAPSFVRVHDSLVRDSRFTRDATRPVEGGVVHAMALDFAHRVALVGNTFDVAGGPITDTARNDGEAMLTEGGGAVRTESVGHVASATATTLSDPSNRLRTDAFGQGRIPENYGVAIVAGRGAGQTRRVVAYRAPTLTVDRAWTLRPDATSRYATFVWGLEKVLVKDNVFSQNPRGIWLYHTAVRDVELAGNLISEGGGIFLRSDQNLAEKRFLPIYNVLIARNRIVNTTGQWMSHINSVFVSADAAAFGIATLGIEIRDNEITANRPNLGSQREDYANTEGIANLMRLESRQALEATAVPRLLGTLIVGNRCERCDVAVRVGTGAAGTVIAGPPADPAGRVEDSATVPGTERSGATVVLH